MRKLNGIPLIILLLGFMIVLNACEKDDDFSINPEMKESKTFQ